MNLAIWHNILWSPYKAGVFTALANLMAAREARLMVFQICETDSQRDKLSGVNYAIHRYPYDLLFSDSRDRVASPALWARVLARTIANPADVTIISGLDRIEYWLQAIYLAAAGRKRAVFYDSTADDRTTGALKGMAKRLFFKLVPFTLSYGQRARAYAIAQGVAPERAFIRCQAAYLPADYDAEAVVRDRTANAATVAGPIFLYVGRLAIEKNLRLLFAAFERFAEGHPEARLRLVGDGSKSEILRVLASTLAHGDRIEFLGPRSGPELAKEYLAASALVLPSASEPWGLVVNEALHHGCPVIVSDRCGCVPELVEDSPCGAVFAYGDLADLVRVMGRALDWSARPGEVARQCLDRIAPYTPEAAAQQTLDAAAAIAGISR